MMNRILFLLLIGSCVMVFTDASFCSVTVFEKMKHPPDYDNKLYYKPLGLKAKTNDSSFDLESCDPTQEKYFRLKSTPNILTSRTKTLDITLMFRLDADLISVLADISITLYKGAPPIHYGGAFDCSNIPDIPCPFPLKENDWVQLSAECRPNMQLPIGQMDAKVIVSNYYDQTAVCIKGQLNIYK
ncbi:uncharacterized protein [Antedon mediterranea]|uniref:uncharacterized protein n=1 Tax=Antedon mediterranea TaxID=105859 RepID=UPI003AF9C1FF